MSDDTPVSSQKVDLKLFAGVSAERNTNGNNGGSDVSSGTPANQRRVVVVGSGSSSLAVDDEKVGDFNKQLV